MDWSLTIDSDLREIPGVKTRLAESLEACGVARASIQDAQLIAEEVIANIIRHGYESEPGHRISLNLVLRDEALTLTFEDDAPAFDPRSHQRDHGAVEDPDAMPMGGVGVLLIQRISEHVDYRRAANSNCLTIRQRVDRER